MFLELKTAIFKILFAANVLELKTANLKIWCLINFINKKN